MQIAFDHEKYMEEQSSSIIKRVNEYDKLYLEFGGKLLSDYHAKRVLPGFDENAKIKLLEKLADKLEIIICVYAGDIERNKMRGDFGITYDMEVLRLIDDLNGRKLKVNSVVITRYNHQPSTDIFLNKLKQRDVPVHTHYKTAGYPTDIETIVSPQGYGKNAYIETTKPIVVVTGPGPASGKMATCLSQLYHEHQRGRVAGYSKFETFPVWDLPLKHPVNIAYESATVDLKDINMIDSFHMDAYGTLATNYNRDIATFPLLKRIIEKITGQASPFKSPTDMGVNRLSAGIMDDKLVQKAAHQEIIRRYLTTACDHRKGYASQEAVERSKLLMEELGLKPQDRLVVMPARNKAACLKEEMETDKICSAMALQLKDGSFITGKGSKIMHAGAALVLNAVKELAHISQDIHLISPVILEPLRKLKTQTLGGESLALTCEEILIALSICAVTNPVAQAAMDRLPQLQNTQAHSTTILNHSDERIFQKLGIDATCDQVFPSENLYYNI